MRLCVASYWYSLCLVAPRAKVRLTSKAVLGRWGGFRRPVGSYPLGGAAEPYRQAAPAEALGAPGERAPEATAPQAEQCRGALEDLRSAAQAEPYSGVPAGRQWAALVELRLAAQAGPWEDPVGLQAG